MEYVNILSLVMDSDTRTTGEFKFSKQCNLQNYPENSDFNCGQNAHKTAFGCECDKGYTNWKEGVGCSLIELDCGAHAQQDGTECVCDNGYENWTAGSGCSLIELNCGAHAQQDGTECVCDDDYENWVAGSGCSLIEETCNEYTITCENGQATECVEGAYLFKGVCYPEDEDWECTEDEIPIETMSGYFYCIPSNGSGVQYCSETYRPPLFEVRLICDCEEKHYYDEDEFKCIPCPDEKALYCTADGVTTCVGGYTVEDGRCVECDGAEGVASWNTCTYSGCNSCAVSACKEGYCHNNHRVTTSNSSYFTDYCEKIPTGNGICDGNNGVVCDNGYHYNGEDCVVCPDANATSCDSEGKSTVCKAGYYKDNEDYCLKCQNNNEGVEQWSTKSSSACGIETCKDGYCLKYVYGVYPGTTYSGPLNECQKIPTGNGICDGNKGVVCNNGYYYNGDNCVVCPDENATSCDTLGISTSCKSSDYYLTLGRCCPKGSTLNESEGTCLGCTDTETLGVCSCSYNQYADGKGGCCPVNSSANSATGNQTSNKNCYCLTGYAWNGTECLPICASNDDCGANEYCSSSGCKSVGGYSTFTSSTGKVMRISSDHMTRNDAVNWCQKQTISGHSGSLLDLQSNPFNCYTNGTTNAWTLPYSFNYGSMSNPTSDNQCCCASGQQCCYWNYYVSGFGETTNPVKHLDSSKESEDMKKLCNYRTEELWTINMRGKDEYYTINCSDGTYRFKGFVVPATALAICE